MVKNSVAAGYLELLADLMCPSPAPAWDPAHRVALRRRPASPARHSAGDFSIVAPLAGAHDASEAYIGRLAELARAGAEVLICVASERDEAVARVRAQWPGAPILFGNDSTFNPKLNNVRKGLEAASRPVVALCDAGVALTAGRSLAVDRHFMPLGLPLWLDLPSRRGLVIAQDTGGAIRGPVRGDVFWGTGAAAGEIAGRMKDRGRYWLLMPRGG